MAKAALKVKELFQDHQRPLTLTEIKKFSPQLKASEISMALCHYTKARHLTYVLINNTHPKGRKQVKQYTWHQEKVTNENPQ